jgi:hypothetical protein
MIINTNLEIGVKKKLEKTFKMRIETSSRTLLIKFYLLFKKVVNLAQLYKEFLHL